MLCKCTLKHKDKQEMCLSLRSSWFKRSAGCWASVWREAWAWVPAEEGQCSFGPLVLTQGCDKQPVAEVCAEGPIPCDINPRSADFAILPDKQYPSEFKIWEMLEWGIIWHSPEGTALVYLNGLTHSVFCIPKSAARALEIVQERYLLNCSIWSDFFPWGRLQGCF